MSEFYKLIKTIFTYGKINKVKIVLSVLISICIALLQSVPVKIIQIIMDDGFLKRDYNLILLLSVVLIFIYIGKSLLSYLLNKLSMLMSKQLTQNLRESIFNVILKSDYETYSRYDSSYLNHRINETNSIGEIFSPNIFNIITTILEAIFVFVLLFRINFIILLVLLLPIPFLFLIIKNKNKKLELDTRVLMEKLSNQSQVTTEKISGLEHIQKNAKEQNELKEIRKIDEDVLKAKYSQGLLYKKITEMITFYISILPVLLYAFGGYIYLKNQISLGGIISFSTSITKIYSPFLNIAIFTVNIKSIKTACRRFMELLEEFHDKSIDGEILKMKVNDIKQITFQSVGFKYKVSDKYIFDDISFELVKGDILKISGENGSGKSTLIKLILGILIPVKGEVYVNSYSYKDVNLNSLRKCIGIVDQNIFLFNDSIKKNILYSSEEVISDEYFKNIIKVLKLDKDYSIEQINNITIGQNGKKLSGGERQKVALARILIKDCDIVIFDESIANIDSDIRRVVKDIIKHRLKNKIVILVDHNNYFDDIITKDIYLSEYLEESKI